MSGTDEAARKLAKLAKLDAAFAKAIPFNAWLGLEAVGREDDAVTLRLPHDPKLIGNPVTGVLHGGVITAAMDAASGAAVFLALRTPRRIATLDLRIDYLRASEPRRDVYCYARCYRVTEQVAFTRGVAFHLAEGGSADDPDARVAIANTVGTFMVFGDAEGSVLANELRDEGEGA